MPGLLRPLMGDAETSGQQNQKMPLRSTVRSYPNLKRIEVGVNHTVHSAGLMNSVRDAIRNAFQKEPVIAGSASDAATEAA